MDTTKLLTILRKKAYGRDWFALGVSYVGPAPHPNHNHFITRVQSGDGSMWDIHTQTGFLLNDPEGCANRIIFDIHNELAGICPGRKGTHDHWCEPVMAAPPASGGETIAKVTGNARCLLCGSPGDDLAVKFYCSNKACANYHP